MNIITRFPEENELCILYNIWKTVFGESGMDAFFRHYYSPQMCIVAEHDSKPAAAGYLVPFGDFVYSGETLPCGMIYSIATLPEYRGKGLGAAVVNRLISLAFENDYPVVVLCPSESGLYKYYESKTKMKEFFYANEIIIKSKDIQTNLNTEVLNKLSGTEYKNRRDMLLTGKTHISQNIKTFEYQSLLNKEVGGGFYSLDDCLILIERESNKTVHIKELLTTAHEYNMQTIIKIIASIKKDFPADEYIIRFPTNNQKNNKFGMLISRDENIIINTHDLLPWYGIPFD